MTIADRINIIAKTKADKKKDFAELMGWEANYLSKLTSGKQGIGLTPLMQLLAKFKDIDARWLLFGEGEMMIRTKKKKEKHSS